MYQSCHHIWTRKLGLTTNPKSYCTIPAAERKHLDFTMQHSSPLNLSVTPFLLLPLAAANMQAALSMLDQCDSTTTPATSLQSSETSTEPQRVASIGGAEPPLDGPSQRANDMQSDKPSIGSVGDAILLMQVLRECEDKEEEDILQALRSLGGVSGNSLFHRYCSAKADTMLSETWPHLERLGRLL